MAFDIEGLLEEVERKKRGNKNETLQDIVTSIQRHTSEEERLQARNRTIGRACIERSNSGVQTWWLVNRPMTTDGTIAYGTNISGDKVSLGLTGITDTYSEDGSVISKHCEFGRLLQTHFSGRHECYYANSRVYFDIFNAAHYIQDRSDVHNLEIGASGHIYQYNDLIQAVKLIKQQKDNQSAIEANRKLQEELLLEAERQKKAYEERQKELKDEAERRRLREEHEKEERKREEAFRAEQERERQLAKESEETERQLKELSDKHSKSDEFIRRHAELKKNPNLSDEQNNIIDNHKFDGITTIIDGGPGTGKTTTLIQRLSALIQKGVLVDYRDNHPDVAKYTDDQIELISKDNGNWIFFSPTELLRQYLLSNMEYEGLLGASTRTFVWEKYLLHTLRDNYHLIGEGAPFTNLRKSEHNKPLFIGDLSIVLAFSKFYVESIKERLNQVAQLDHSKFEWKIAGKIIADTCLLAAKIQSISEMYSLLVRLEALKKQNIQGNTIADLHTEYGQEIEKFANMCITLAKKDDVLINELKRLIIGWDKDEDEDEEELEDENTSGNWELELQRKMKSLLRKVALKKLVRQSITGNNAQLYDLIKHLIDEEKISKLAELAYFNKYYYPVISNAEVFLFSKLTKAYKDFRRNAFKNGEKGWNMELLTYIINNKNKALHPDEQALLLGFINNSIIKIAQTQPLQFERMKHKYVEAYKLLCRPVIGVDEATDYALIDYFAIASLRHYNISSFTLTGDIMQCLRNNGIKNWEGLQQALIFPQVEIKQLNISYRQSSELLKLAKYLYKSTLNEEAPYICKMEDVTGVPKPLWMESNDEQEKAQWIVKRVLDIFKHYGFMPSVALFVATEEDAKILYDNILEIGELEDNGINVLNCSNGLSVADTDAVRIFPLNQVKGMEFEAVFFHNIDIMDRMASNYLYVGLSRATFYMGVTSHESDKQYITELKQQFATGDWQNNSEENIDASTNKVEIIKNAEKGYCIHCGKHIDFSYGEQRPKYLCRDCWKEWYRLGADPKREEKYCHCCGKENRSSTIKPLCKDCWKKEENI